MDNFTVHFLIVQAIYTCVGCTSQDTNSPVYNIFLLARFNSLTMGVVGSKNTMEQDQKHTLPAPLLVCTHSGTGAWSCLITGILHCLLYILRTDANRGCQLFSALLQLTSGAHVSNRQPLRCGASLKAQRRAEPPEGRMLGVSSLQGSCMCTLAVYK